LTDVLRTELHKIAHIYINYSRHFLCCLALGMSHLIISAFWL